MINDAAMIALIEAAQRGRSRASAPDFNYRVGAALRGSDGRIFTGVNVENSAYPTSVWAGVQKFSGRGVVMVTDGGKIEQTKLSGLLPGAFLPEKLLNRGEDQ